MRSSPAWSISSGSAEPIRRRCLGGREGGKTLVRRDALKLYGVGTQALEKKYTKEYCSPINKNLQRSATLPSTALWGGTSVLM